MQKQQWKRLLWTVILIAATLCGLVALQLLGQLVEYVGRGADPASALNLVPPVPLDLDQRVVWMADDLMSPSSDRLDRGVRDQVAGAYLRAWTQLGISHTLGQPYGLATYFPTRLTEMVSAPIAGAAADGWQIRQNNLGHRLQFTFISADRSIVAFRDHDAHLVHQLTHTDSGFTRVVESHSRFDVVMFLEDGRWRIRYWQRLGEAEPRAADLPSAPPLRPWSVTGTRLLVDGRPYQIVGVNYYPQETPWTAFWPHYDPAQTRRDLALMRELGFNTVRIFVPFTEFADSTQGPAHRASLLDFMDQAAAAQLAVIVTLFDHRTDHRLENWPADDRFLAALIAPLAHHPALLAWDLKNEPDRDYELNSPELVDSWLRHVAATLRSMDGQTLITIGWSTPEAAVALAAEVDIVSYHFFADPAHYASRVAQLRQQVPDKPLLLQEFTRSTWNFPFPGATNEAEQASYYAQLLTANERGDGIGVMVWTLYDFTQVPLPEFRTPWQKQLQANMGLIRRDGTAKPAASLFTSDPE